MQLFHLAAPYRFAWYNENHAHRVFYSTSRRSLLFLRDFQKADYLIRIFRRS